MEIGIIGLNQSGKSTLFQIMTGINSREIFGEQFVKGIARVPDARFERLVDIFKPKKISPATVPFVDVNLSGKEAWDKARNGLGTSDGFIHIIDAFTSVSVDEMCRCYRQLEDELILADLIIVENKLERLSKVSQKSMRPEDHIHAKVLPRAKEFLENGRPLRELELAADELASIRGFTFWTIRPELIVLNVSEETGDTHFLTSEVQKCVSPVSPVVAICCQIELEISTLSPADRGEFLASLGIKTPAFERIIQTSFSLIGRMSYFTVGEDEVKAWVIPTNSTAPKAASAIHKDFERGFIKAEVVSYNDFIASGNSIEAARSKGRLRLEGKEYIVQESDIINFRFNV